jgi:uncharacterized protein (DUF1778 family)
MTKGKRRTVVVRKPTPRTDDTLSEGVRVRVTPDEKAAFTAAAKKDNRNLSNWLRSLARRAVGLDEATP